jgi:hypothetical protein
MKTRFITDDKGSKVGIILSIKDYENRRSTHRSDVR